MSVPFVTEEIVRSIIAGSDELVLAPPAIMFLTSVIRFAPTLGYAILDLAPVLQASQRGLNEASGSPIRFLQADASKPLPLKDDSVSLLVSNEVIADLLTIAANIGP